MPGTITPIGIGTALLHTKQATFGASLNPLVAPGNTNPPILGEPTPALSGTTVNQLWLLATGGPNWGGCQVWASTDGTTYAMLGTTYKGGRQGVLTAPLASHSDPDTTDTLSVDLTMSQGSLLSGTQLDADSFITLCFCDGELLSYQTATLTAQYKYNLTYLRRGLYGFPIGAHASGGQFARFSPTDPSVFKYPFPPNLVGRTVYLKLPAFNIFGQVLQSLASVSPYTYTLLGTGGVQPNNPVIQDLQNGVNQDWGIVGTPIFRTADFAWVGLAAGLDIDLSPTFP